MPDETEPKPITSDPDEQELLKDLGIPLTDPNAKKEEPEPVAEPEKPAETPAETPADEEPTEVEVEETPVETPAETPAAQTEKPVPAAEPATAAAKPAPTPQPDALDQEITALEQQIDAEEFDPFSKEGKAAQRQYQRLVARAETRDAARQQAAVDAIYQHAADEHGVDVNRARSLFHDELKKAQERYGVSDAARAVATERWQDQLAAIKNGKKGPEAKAAAEKPATPKPPVAKTPITPAGAKVAPPAQAAVPPAPKAKTDEEELVEWNRKHVPGGIRSLIR